MASKVPSHGKLEPFSKLLIVAWVQIPSARPFWVTPLTILVSLTF